MLTIDQRDELYQFDTPPFEVTPRPSRDCEAFDLVVTVRTPVSSQDVAYAIPFRLTFHEDSPGPTVKLIRGKLFNPNFNSDGEWTASAMKEGEDFRSYFKRLYDTLAYINIDMDHIGDCNAAAWYRREKESGIFPTDKDLPGFPGNDGTPAHARQSPAPTVSAEPPETPRRIVIRNRSAAPASGSDDSIPRIRINIT